MLLTEIYYLYKTNLHLLVVFILLMIISTLVGFSNFEQLNSEIFITAFLSAWGWFIISSIKKFEDKRNENYELLQIIDQSKKQIQANTLILKRVMHETVAIHKLSNQTNQYLSLGRTKVPFHTHKDKFQVFFSELNYESLNTFVYTLKNVDWIENSSQYSQTVLILINFSKMFLADENKITLYTLIYIFYFNNLIFDLLENYEQRIKGNVHHSNSCKTNFVELLEKSEDLYSFDDFNSNKIYSLIKPKVDILAKNYQSYLVRK